MLKWHINYLIEGKKFEPFSIILIKVKLAVHWVHLFIQRLLYIRAPHWAKKGCCLCLVLYSKQGCYDSYRFYLILWIYLNYNVWKVNTIYFYVPPARNLVFSLQLTVAQCSTLRYRGMKCKNWTALAPIAMQRSTIFFLFFFFFVQR